MKNSLVLAIFICGSTAATTLGEVPGTEFQARFLLHKQIAEPGFGFAGWAVASDVTNTGSQRGLLVGGVGYGWGLKGDKLQNWIEVMPGSFVIEDKKPDWMLDVRSSFSLPKGLNLGLEGLRAFRSERSLLITTLTFPVPGTVGRLRFGVESDLIWRAGPDSLGIGPRVVVKANNHLSLGLGFQ